jgi:flagellar basal body-associated protein FliL
LANAVLALTILGLVGFVMMVVASLQYLLSGSNSQQAEKSKQTMTYAVIGIVVALSAFIILNLVAEFTGVKSILNFKIPDSMTQW